MKTFVSVISSVREQDIEWYHCISERILQTFKQPDNCSHPHSMSHKIHTGPLQPNSYHPHEVERCWMVTPKRICNSLSRDLLVSRGAPCKVMDGGVTAAPNDRTNNFVQCGRIENASIPLLLRWLPLDSDFASCYANSVRGFLPPRSLASLSRPHTDLCSKQQLHHERRSSSIQQEIAARSGFSWQNNTHVKMYVILPQNTGLLKRHRSDTRSSIRWSYLDEQGPATIPDT